MLREQSHLILVMHKALDILLTILAFISAFIIKKYFLPGDLRGLIPNANYNTILMMVIIIWYLTFSSFKIYDSYRKKTFSKIFWNMVKAVGIAMMILTMCMYFFKIVNFSRIMMALFFLLNIGLLGLSKAIIFKFLKKIRQKGFNFKNILIIGSREGAKEVIAAIGDRLDAGFKVLGCLEIEKENVGNSVKNGISIIGTIDELKDILIENVIDEIIFSMPLKKIENVEQYIDLAEKFGVTVRILPQWHIQQIGYKPTISSIHFEEFLGLYTMILSAVPFEKTKLYLKNAFDYVASFFILTLSSPLFVIISIMIKLTSKGPVFYKQERVSCNGRKFILYKFRTMVIDAELKKKEIEKLNEVDGPVFKVKNDPRIIPYIGNFLRKTSLDELPQLINVLKGEMSLVGPRPPIPQEVDQYDIWQRRRLSMKPGLTCIWQCSNSRNDICFEEWMNLDLQYIDNWSFGLDLKILMKTVWVVLCCRGR